MLLLLVVAYPISMVQKLVFECEKFSMIFRVKRKELSFNGIRVLVSAILIARLKSAHSMAKRKKKVWKQKPTHTYVCSSKTRCDVKKEWTLNEMKKKYEQMGKCNARIKSEASALGCNGIKKSNPMFNIAVTLCNFPS